MVELTTKTRDEVIAQYQRDYLLRCPDALTGPGTQPYLAAVLLADQLMPVYANCTHVANAIDLEQRTLTELTAEAARLGVTLTGASGSSGFVVVRTATGGAVIPAGAELVEPNTKLVYYCTTTGLYANGASVPVAARSAGPGTNQPAATVLQWSSPVPGLATTCSVEATTSGDGLVGGADEEGREQVIAKIRDHLANPPGSGNDADYQRWIRATIGVQVEAAFIYPCAFGPGTTGWTFTVAPDRYGSRVPSAAQIALVRAGLSLAPRTDLRFHLPIVAEPTPIVCSVTWATDADQWADETPWPAYFPQAPGAGSGAIRVSAATSPLTFTLEAANGDYTTCGDPATGQALAVWDATARVFRNKRILSVVGGGPWGIVCDGTFAASDTTYTPVVGQRAMPWSASLAQLAAPVIAFFDGVGPGEANAVTYLDGQRARRDPGPAVWPYRVTKALEASLAALSSVDSLDLAEGSGVAATVSTAPNLLTLSDLAAFPA